jgi:hypothetical protein
MTSPVVRRTTLEGTAEISENPETTADAERRYTQRYKQPRPSPERIVILVTATRATPPSWEGGALAVVGLMFRARPAAGLTRRPARLARWHRRRGCVRGM